MKKELDFQARNIQFLEFEINNQCPNASLHKWCPRHILGTEPVKELTTEIIKNTFEFFKQYDFSGSVYFSIYNEPLMDKRIFDLIEWTKKNSRATVQMYSSCVTYDNAKEMFDRGLDILRISVYKPELKAYYEEISKRLKNEGYNQIFEIWDRTYSGWLGYDDRLGIYDRKVFRQEECYHPIQYFMVYSDGNVGLCFDDWKETVIFGNVYQNSIEEILMDPVRLETIEKLKRGERGLIPVCSGCDRPREMCITEYRERLKL